MRAYRLFIKSSAEKEMNALPEAVHQRAGAKILNLQHNPRPLGCQKLHGTDGYRIRIGDYRVLYTVEDNSGTVTIYAVAHRREAYR